MWQAAGCGGSCHQAPCVAARWDADKMPLQTGMPSKGGRPAAAALGTRGRGLRAGWPGWNASSRLQRQRAFEDPW